MSTEVDRARGLEREGIQTDRVRWNLSTAVLYEEAVRRQEGMIAAAGRSRAGPASTPGARPTTSSSSASRRARRRSRGARSTGRSSRRSSTRCTRIWSRRSPARSSSSSTASPAPIRRTACRSGSSTSSPGTTCSAATCSSTIRRRPRRGAPQFTIIDSPSFKADPETRHGTQLGRDDRAELREEAGAHRRHAATPAR